MFNDAFSHMQLMDLLRPHMGKSAWPGIDDPDAVARARKTAKVTGVWKTIGDTVSRLPSFPGMPYSIVARCCATGQQVEFGKQLWHDLFPGTHAAALAVWLDHPKASVSQLEDYLAGWCEMNDWIHPSHQKDINLGADLTSAHIGNTLAEYWWVLRDKIDQGLRNRIAENVETRLLLPAVDHRRFNWWLTGENNWNHVVIACLIGTALYQYENPYTLASYIHPLIENLKYGLKGYADDGGCTEGPNYWSYGFQHFLKAAVMLHHRTGGAVDLVRGHPQIERICRYPLASHLDGPIRTCWADSYHGHISFMDAELINRFHKLPQLYTLCKKDAAGWGGAGLSIESLLAARKLSRIKSDALYADAILSGLGTCKAYAAGCRKPVAVAALAGHNGVNHNHNDVGTFLYYRDGICFLTDPGYPTYTAQHFSPARYTKFHCRSFGHSVPLIDGEEQVEGIGHYGTLACEGFGGNGDKTMVIDMTHAYAVKHLSSLVRTLTLAPDGTLTLSDAYVLTRAPKALEEAFITYEPARVAKDGKSVVIGKGKTAATLRSVDTLGRFEAKTHEEESAEGRGQGLITRIRFVPKTLTKEMALTFSIR